MAEPAGGAQSHEALADAAEASLEPQAAAFAEDVQFTRGVGVHVFHGDGVQFAGAVGAVNVQALGHAGFAKGMGVAGLLQLRDGGFQK